jgi:hypothetical protein
VVFATTNAITLSGDVETSPRNASTTPRIDPEAIPLAGRRPSRIRCGTTPSNESGLYTAFVRGYAPAIVSAFSAGFFVATAMSGTARPQQQQAAGDSFEIVPGARFGPIRETTTRAALSSIFPPESIQDTEIYIAEGFCTNGTRVFPDSADEIDVA